MLKKSVLPRVGTGAHRESESLTISHNIGQQTRLNGISTITPVMVNSDEIERFDNSFNNNLTTENYPDGYESPEQMIKEERRALMRFKALRFYKFNNRRGFKSKVNENLEQMYNLNNSQDYCPNNQTLNDGSFISTSEGGMVHVEHTGFDYKVGNSVNLGYRGKNSKILGESYDRNTDFTIYKTENSLVLENQRLYDIMRRGSGAGNPEPYMQSRDLEKYKKVQHKKPFLHKIVRTAKPKSKRRPIANSVDFYADEASYNLAMLLNANNIIPKGVNMKYVTKQIEPPRTLLTGRQARVETQIAQIGPVSGTVGDTGQNLQHTPKGIFTIKGT
jgi:hypothetical protein